jgi:hypothetical protein
MILYIIKWTLLYSILIFLMHNLYLFFKSNLTNTKIKDYYNTFSIEKDNNVISNSNNLLFDKINISSTSLDNLQNNVSNDTMKNELNEFLQKIKL